MPPRGISIPYLYPRGGYSAIRAPCLRNPTALHSKIRITIRGYLFADMARIVVVYRGGNARFRSVAMVEGRLILSGTLRPSAFLVVDAYSASERFRRVVRFPDIRQPAAGSQDFSCCRVII